MGDSRARGMIVDLFLVGIPLSALKSKGIS